MQDNLIIIRVDGGIASQIGFVALGKAFEERGCRVKYDIGWFESSGRKYYSMSKGYDKDYNLSFDIPKAFPSLPIEIASKSEVRQYKNQYYIEHDSVISYPPPLYVGGYLGRHYDMYFSSLFASTFEPKEVHEKGSAFYNLLQEILGSQSCGIHIRRGDLAQYNESYGEPTSFEYFRRAIWLATRMQPQSIFYLFSDDVAFVREHIAPLIENHSYKICDINTPEQGYLDLYLLSRCQVIIASHGSLGVYAKILSPHNPLLITSRHFKIFHEMSNVMLVNWGEQLRLSKPSAYIAPPPAKSTPQPAKQNPPLYLSPFKKQIIA